MSDLTTYWAVVDKDNDMMEYPFQTRADAEAYARARADHGQYCPYTVVKVTPVAQYTRSVDCTEIVNLGE